eukprot:5190504-Prymnesium_polylepis.2
MPAEHKERAHKAIRDGRSFVRGAAGSGATIEVDCYPLSSVMMALGRKTVDYWSLDTEGSEPAILNATDFDAVEVGIITVEHNSQPQLRRQILSILNERGFVRAVALRQDDYFVNPSYFTRRGLVMPVKSKK